MSVVAATTHHAHVAWDASRDDLRAHTIWLKQQTLACSSQPTLGGDTQKADPEELLVAALSSCHMLWFLDFARRERIRVTSYDDAAEGAMDGTRFTRVVLRPRIEFGDEDAPDAATLDDLHHRAHDACFIANSVNFPVEVEPR